MASAGWRTWRRRQNTAPSGEHALFSNTVSALLKKCSKLVAHRSALKSCGVACSGRPVLLSEFI